MCYVQAEGGVRQASLPVLHLHTLPRMVLGSGTHVEEPVLANGMLELSTDFVKISRIAEQVLWNENRVFFAKENNLGGHF